MVDRDEDHRPIATRNAGAFFSPARGPTPVPMDIDRYWEKLPPKRRWSRLIRNLVVVVFTMAIVFIVLWVLTPSAAPGLLLFIS